MPEPFITVEEVNRDSRQRYLDAMFAVGLTFEKMVLELRDQLNASVTKTQKVKGAVQDNLPDGYRIVAETEEETLVQWEEKNWNVSQGALFELHKLYGLYPADKHELTGKDGGPIRSEEAVSVQAGPGIQAVIERLIASGIAGPGPEDSE